MTNNLFSLVRQHLATCAWIVLISSAALKGALPAQLECADRTAFEASAENVASITSASGETLTFAPSEGVEDLDLLLRVNAELEKRILSGELNTETIRDFEFEGKKVFEWADPKDDWRPAKDPRRTQEDGLVFSETHQAWVADLHPKMVTEGGIKVTEKDGERIVVDNRQISPFRSALFPFAHTGALIPVSDKAKKIKVDGNRVKDYSQPRDIKPEYLSKKTYPDLALLGPGIGFKNSRAESMCSLARAYLKGSVGMEAKEIDWSGQEKPKGAANFEKTFHYLPDSNGKAVAVPIDMPFNGLGMDAPFALGSELGSMAVIRHAHLVLLALFTPPTNNLADLKGVVFNGRSHSGLWGVQYAKLYEAGTPEALNFYASVALNPSHTSDAQVQFVNDNYTGRSPEDAHQLGLSSIADMVVKAWAAHNHYTPEVDIFAGTVSVPTRLMLGAQDASYDQPHYLQDMTGKLAAQQGLVDDITYPRGGHDLWSHFTPRFDGEEVEDYQVRKAQFEAHLADVLLQQGLWLQAQRDKATFLGQ